MVGRNPKGERAGSNTALAAWAAQPDLRRAQARLVAETGRILLRAMGVMARQQTDALHAMLGELADAPRPTSEDGQSLAALQDQYLRLSLHAFVAQMQLGLEAAAAVQAATMDLLEGGVLAATRATVDEAAATESPD